MTALFERSEYLLRVRNTRERMQEAGVDVLLVVSPENMNYLSGYAGWSFYTPQVLLVPVEEEEPTLIVRETDVACALLVLARAGTPDGLPRELHRGAVPAPHELHRRARPRARLG